MKTREEWESILTMDLIARQTELVYAKRAIPRIEKELKAVEEELEFVLNTKKKELTFEEVILLGKELN